MKAKTLVSILLLSGSTLATLPGFAASTDEFFWKELQRTDGFQDRDVSSAIRTSPGNGGARGDSNAGDWFSVERQKTDGYVVASDTATADARAEMRKPAVRPKS